MAEPTYNKGPDQVIPSELRYTHKLEDAVKLRVPSDRQTNSKPISVPSLLRNTSERYPNREAMCVKRQGVWHSTTFSEYYQLARTAAKAFIKLGLQKFEGVAIMGFNAPEYFIANMGAIMAGGISTGLYTTSSAATCEFYLKNTNIAIMVVENNKYRKLIRDASASAGKPLKAIVQWSESTPEKPDVFSWEEFLEMGAACDDDQLEERLRGIAVNQCSAVIYTSGTVGKPKGVMISHDIFTWTAEHSTAVLPFTDGVDTIVSYLPLCHGAAQILDMYACLRVACTVFFAQPDALKGSLIETLTEIRPTLFLGVPRIYEKMYEKFTAVLSAGGISATIINWCRAQAADYWKLKEKDPSTPVSWSLTAANLILGKVRDKIGMSYVRGAATSAAPISSEVIGFIQSLNIPIFEMYGLSETCGPVTVNSDLGFKLGTIGKTFCGCKTRILDPDEKGNGEILHWGRNIFMGYLQRPDANKETIDEDDWLHTGDVGRVDEEGFITITGRIKELLITAAGKNIAPVAIEDAIKGHLPFVSNCVVIGDKKKYLSALLTFKVEMNVETGEPTDQLLVAAKNWLEEHGVVASTVTEALQNLQKFRGAIQKGVDTANGEAESHAFWVQKWTLLKEEFSIPGGELGPTLKMRRQVITSKYTKEIEALYR